MGGSVWLLTWTTYGTWLPGDDRGFVGYIRQRPADLRQRLDTDDARADDARADDARADDARADDARADDASRRVIHNTPGTPYDRNMPGLRRYAQDHMKGKPIWLRPAQADVFLAEAIRTAEFRKWSLLAAAVMANHVHLVVVVPDDLPGERLLREFKSYGSRALNQRFGKPTSGTWWTKSGSTRLLPNERAVSAAVEYVRQQHRPLVLWIADSAEHPSTPVDSERRPSTSVDGSKVGDSNEPIQKPMRQQP